MESIHERIKRLREAKGLSMEQLAEVVGVSWQTVQQWEKKTAPKRTRVKKVADELGVSENELLFGVKDVVLPTDENDDVSVLPTFASFGPKVRVRNIDGEMLLVMEKYLTLTAPVQALARGAIKSLVDSYADIENVKGAAEIKQKRSSQEKKKA